MLNKCIILLVSLVLNTTCDCCDFLFDRKTVMLYSVL